MELNGLDVIIKSVNVFEDQDIHDSFLHDCPWPSLAALTN